MTVPEKPDQNTQSVFETRLQKLADLRSAGVEAYPATSGRTHVASEVRKDFKKLEKAGTAVTLAGRLMTFRQHGRISFANLRDTTGPIQLAFQQDVLGKEEYGSLSGLDMGDFLEVTGELFVTKKGEETLAVSNYRLLTKSLRPLPEKWHGLKDPEERYRRRYLDMIANPEVREKLLVRSKLILAIRQFLAEKGFVELENPILEVQASGAAAKPFKTHINAYDMDLYLRISIGELWQKRSLVGGFEKVYEIGRAFRNEGVDYSHNPDFTMLEYYWAYADYEDNLKFHEELIPFVVKAATGSLKVEYEGTAIDFKPPYPRITFREAILEGSGIDIDKERDAPRLRKAMSAKGFDVDASETYRQLLDGLFKSSFRMKQVQPIFVTHYPEVLKPLAKKSPGVAGSTESFQLVVATYELSNSYSELNDPVEQRARFEEQGKLAKAGDDEAMLSDPDFIEALEYGMPPATGTGIGIDRFAALLTGSHSIREVTAYPLMKPKRDE